MAQNRNIIKKLDDFILVTRQNMRAALAVGDTFYIIESRGNQFEIKGQGHIGPMLKKGWYTIENMPHGTTGYCTFDVFIKEAQSPNEYQESFDPIFKLVDQRKIYVAKNNRVKTKYTLKS